MLGLMEPPDRVTVPTCIGCGAMERWGTCEASCSEHKLELVGAAEFDELKADRAATRDRVRALRPVVEAMTRTEAGPDGWQAAYRRAQQDALAVLSGLEDGGGSREPADHVTTWWCAECGGIEAPQPCLGICVWRPADWVNRAVYLEERARAAADADAERLLARLLRRLASVTPRQDQWEHCWARFRAEAGEALRGGAQQPAGASR